MLYHELNIFSRSYDEMVDIGHLRCPGLDRVGSTPTNRNINIIYIYIYIYIYKGEVLMLVIRPKL